PRRWPGGQPRGRLRPDPVAVTRPRDAQRVGRGVRAAARPPGRRDVAAGRRTQGARLQGGGDRGTTGPGPADRSSQDPPHPESLAGGGPPMNGDQPPGTGSAPLSLQKRVDEVCDRFEEAWKGGQRPHIEDYLAEVPETDRVPLLRELL